MPKSQDVLARVRAICLALPDTKETPTWGKPHFRVGEKIFAGCEDGVVGMKLDKGHATALIAADPRCTRAPYVGHAGWISMDLGGAVNWDEVRELILESYRLIAPKKSLAKLGGGASEGAPRRKPARAAAKKGTRARKKAPASPARSRTSARKR
jgi:predicted DNA-binding protein (MmcQ/YjbR family)